MASARGLEAVESEARHVGAVEVPIGDSVVWVKPVADWPVSAMRAVKEGDFDTWAEKCLTDGSYATWQMVDPTMSQVEVFFAELNAATGQNPGKSRTSQRR